MAETPKICAAPQDDYATEISRYSDDALCQMEGPEEIILVQSPPPLIESTGNDDLTPYGYSDDIQNSFNNFATRYDPTPGDQLFTFTDFQTLFPTFWSLANDPQHPDLALSGALKNFFSFKQYLDTQIQTEETVALSTASESANLAGQKALTADGRDFLYLKKITPEFPLDAAAFSAIRFLCAIAADEETPANNGKAKILVRNQTTGELEFYILDQALFLADYSEKLLKTGDWTSLNFTTPGYEVVEVFTSCGHILENISPYGHDDGKTALHVKSKAITGRLKEKSSRISLPSTFLGNNKELIDNILNPLPTASAKVVLRIPDFLLPLATAQQRALWLKLLLQSSFNAEQVIRAKIFEIIEAIPSSVEPDHAQKMVGALEPHIVSALIRLMDGEHRIELLKALHQKGYSGDLFAHELKPAAFEVGQQITFGIGRSGLLLVKPFLHPIDTLSQLGSLNQMLYSAVVGGRTQVGNQTVSTRAVVAQVPGNLWDESRAKDEAAAATGYGVQYQIEKNVEIAVEETLILWGAHAAWESIKKYAVGSLKVPAAKPLAGITAGYGLGVLSYNALADYDTRSQYMSELAQCIEEAYDNFGNPIWALNTSVRRFTNPTRGSMDEYLHCLDDEELSSRSLSVLGHVGAFFDNDEACRYYATLGLQGFQQKYGAKYFKEIFGQLQRIYTEKEPAGEDAIKTAIEAYLQNSRTTEILNFLGISQNREIFEDKQGKNVWGSGLMNPLQRLGIYSFNPNFDILLPALKQSLTQPDVDLSDISIEIIPAAE